MRELWKRTPREIRRACTTLRDEESYGSPKAKLCDRNRTLGGVYGVLMGTKFNWDIV